MYTVGFKSNCFDILNTNRFYVYRLEHIQSKKTYIGITNNPSTRCRGHMGKQSYVTKQFAFTDPKNWNMEILEVIDLNTALTNKIDKRSYLSSVEKEFILKEIAQKGRKNVLNRILNVQNPISQRKVDIIRKDIDKAIVKVLNKYPNGLLTSQLQQEVHFRKQLFYQALNHLIDLGLVMKHGKGCKADPYRITLTYTRSTGVDNV